MTVCRMHQNIRKRTQMERDGTLLQGAWDTSYSFHQACNQLKSHQGWPGGLAIATKRAPGVGEAKAWAPPGAPHKPFVEAVWEQGRGPDGGSVPVMGLKTCAQELRQGAWSRRKSISLWVDLTPPSGCVLLGQVLKPHDPGKQGLTANSQDWRTHIRHRGVCVCGGGVTGTPFPWN